MKPPRRFVVEYKANRRQSKAQTNSIWGDTDFKALALEVESQASHLFATQAGDGVSDTDEKSMSPSECFDALHLISEAEPASIAAEPASESHEVTEEHVAAAPVTEPEMLTPPSQPASKARRAAKSTPRASKRQLPRSEAAVPAGVTSSESMDATAVTSQEELAALDAENRHLKRLLAKRLRLENLQLQKMLERFDTAVGTHGAL
jgi:hypothetical protein